MSERMSLVPHSYINYYSNWILEHGSIKLMWQGNLKRGKSFVILLDEPEPRIKDSGSKPSTSLKTITTTTTTSTSTTTMTTTTPSSTTTTTSILRNITRSAAALIPDNYSANLSFKSEPEYYRNSSWIILGTVISVLALCMLVLLLAHKNQPKTEKGSKSSN